MRDRPALIREIYRPRQRTSAEVDALIVEARRFSDGGLSAAGAARRLGVETKHLRNLLLLRTGTSRWPMPAGDKAGEAV